MIKIGFFKDFNGEDSIHISVDEPGLQEMIYFFAQMAQSNESIEMLNLNGSDPRFRMAVLAVQDESPIGMRAVAKDAFEWRVPAARWLQFKEMAQNLRSGRCHHYLDCDEGDGKDLQVVLSIGEYGEAWWEEFFEKIT